MAHICTDLSNLKQSNLLETEAKQNFHENKDIIRKSEKYSKQVHFKEKQPQPNRN